MRPSFHCQAGATIGAVLLASVFGCTDSPVPYFTAPTSIPSSAAGVQNGVTGVFSNARTDQYYLVVMSAFARDALNFLSFDPQYVTEIGGLIPPSDGDFLGDSEWPNQFLDALQVNNTIAALPKAGFSTAQVAALTGVLQTMKARSFMIVAETRDTLGVPVYAITNGGTSPFYCNKDVWTYIVALLDSGNAQLNAAGSIAIPVVLPPGFGSVSAMAAPSTSLGAFAAFNRALAAKAGLELAYAIARSTPGNAPTPTTPGAPDVTALTRADSAMLASALYDPAVITPPPVGAYTLDPYGVYDTYSAQSGDIANPLNIYVNSTNALYDMQYDVDTVGDLRWLHKFSVNPVPLQSPNYNPVATQYLYSSFLSPSSPVPIVRDEELTLVRAQIRLGLGDFAGAIGLINTVHEQAGGYATPLTIAATYTAVRDSLLKEQRISTVLEGSGDRAIAIRMYGLQSVSDTTWQATAGPDAVAVGLIATSNGGTKPVDLHTTVLPIPAQELTARNGSYNLSCP